MATVRELLVRWDFKVDEKPLRNLERSISDVGNVVKLAGAAAIASAGALFGLAKSVADVADNARKTAQSVGLTTEVFQELAFAAELGGVKQEELAGSLRLLARNALDASRGSETTARAFRELGVEITDVQGNLRPTESILLDIADVFKDLPDGPKKTGLALEILGRSGSKLIPTLNQGALAMVELGEEARRSGAIISDEMAQDAEEMNDSLVRARKAVFGVTAAVGKELFPIIQNIALAFRDWAVENRELIVQRLHVVVDLAKEAVRGAFIATRQFVVTLRDLVTWFQNNQFALFALKNLLVIFLGVLAVQKVAQFVSALQALRLIILGVNAAILANPIGLIIALIGALAAFAIVNWDDIRLGAEIMWEAITEATTRAAAFFIQIWRGTVDRFQSQVLEPIQALWDTAGTALQESFTSVRDFFQETWQGVADWFQRVVIDPIVSRFEAVRGLAEDAAEFFGIGAGGAPAAPGQTQGPAGQSPGRPGSPESRITPTPTSTGLQGMAPSPISQRTINIESSLTFSLPAAGGMSTTQVDELESRMRRATREEIDRVTREALSDFP